MRLFACGFGLCVTTLTLLALAPTATAQTATAPVSATDAPAQRLIDEGLAAVLAGDLARAELLFARAALEAETPQMRHTAALLADRVRALAGRPSAGPAPAAAIAGGKGSAGGGSAGARALMLVTTTGLGLGVWGWTLPAAMGMDNFSTSSRPFLGLYMLTAAASFAGPFWLTRDNSPSYGQANLGFYGGTRGILYGFLFSQLLRPDRPERDNSEQLQSASLLLGSLGGVIAGTIWAERAGMSPGQARTVGVLGDLGLVSGLLGALIVNGDDDSSPGEDQLQAGFGLAGAALGVAGGRWFSVRRQHSWGDGEVMRGGGAYGALLGATTVVTLGYENHWRPAMATVLTGALLGTAGGDRLVQGTNFSVAGAILVDLALLSGGLAGAGIFHLIDGGKHDNGYLPSASLGAGLASGFAFLTLRDWGGGDHASTGLPGLALLPLLTSRHPGTAAGGLSGLAVAGRF